MNTKDTMSNELQELLDKVFPPYTGDLKGAIIAVVTTVEEDNYHKAANFCTNFRPCSPDTSEADWAHLDWALSVPGVAENFPELVDALQQHYTFHISKKDFVNMIDSIIVTTSAMVRDVYVADKTAGVCLAGLSKYLPKQMVELIEHYLVKEGLRQCDRECLPVDRNKR